MTVLNIDSSQAVDEDVNQKKQSGWGHHVKPSEA